MAKPATTFRSRGASGFTVVLSTGLLSAVALVMYFYVERHQAPAADTPAQTQEKIAAAKAFVTTQIDTMLSTYKKDTGNYPVSAESLWSLVEAPPGTTGWRGPYLTHPSMPLDPWGQPYQYNFPGIHNPDKYDVWSRGPDQMGGTADDICNW